MYKEIRPVHESSWVLLPERLYNALRQKANSQLFYSADSLVFCQYHKNSGCELELHSKEPYVWNILYRVYTKEDWT